MVSTTKEKSLSYGEDRQGVKEISLNNSISDRQKLINLFFKNLSGYIEVREFGETVKKLWFDSAAELIEYEPPTDKDIYVGMATRNSKRSGKAWNCEETGVLWADYDDVDSLSEVKDLIDHAYLPEPAVYVNSGHGYHAYWLLDEPVKAWKVNSLLRNISNRTGSDGKVAESARIMRLPATINNKNEPVKCEVVEFNNVDPLSFQEWLDIAGIKATDIQDNRFKQQSNIKLPDTDKPCINSILKGVEQCQRNWALGRLTKWLQAEGYPKDKSFELVKKWNQSNEPPQEVNEMERSFKAYWHGDYKLLGCKIPSTELQANLKGHCNRHTCKLGARFDKLIFENQVSINNRIFNEYPYISGYEIIVYGVLLAEPEGLNTTNLKEELTSRNGRKCMSRQKLMDTIDKLNSLGLIDVRYRHTQKRATFCKATKKGTYGLGYTLLSNGAINMAICGEVTPAELKLYLLLMKYAFRSGQAFPATTTLGKELGIHRTNVSKYLKNLEQARMIKRHYNYDEKGRKKLVCKLLV